MSEIEKDPETMESPNVLFFLGRCYSFKRESLDYDEISSSEKFMKMASGKGHIQAINYLFNIYTSSKNFDKAFQFLKDLESNEFPVVYDKIGYCYFQGIGCDPDFKKSIEYLERAIKLEYKPSYGNLGYLYLNGSGVKKNIKKAIELMDLSESAISKFLLGSFFIDSENKEYYDEKKAHYYFDLARSIDKSFEFHQDILNEIQRHKDIQDTRLLFNLLNVIQTPKSQDYSYTKDNIVYRSEKTTIYKVLIKNQPVAIKRIRNNMNNEEVENYLNILKKVTFYTYLYQSLNVLKYIGSFLDDSKEYIHLIFDYYEKTLESCLFKDGKPCNILTYDDKILIIKKIANTMKTLHSHDIIHRDLKPSNIMISEDKEIFITDFGISQQKEYKVTKSHQKTTAKKGTHFYKPIELVQKGYFGEFTDSYSFGIMLFEIFQEKSIVEVFEKFKNMAIEVFYIKDGCSLIDKLEIKENESLNKLMHLCTQKDYLKRPSFHEILIYLNHMKVDYSNLIN